MRLITLITLALLLTACSSYPLGMSKKSWEALTPEQQLDAAKKQAEIDEEKAARLAEQRRLQAEAEAKYLAEMAEKRANAKPGDIVQCVLQPIEVYRGKKWVSAKPVSFDLVVGEVASARLSEKDGYYSTELFATFNQQRFIACEHKYDLDTGRNCLEVAGTLRQFDQGIQRKFNLHERMRGVVYCDNGTLDNRKYRRH